MPSLIDNTIFFYVIDCRDFDFKNCTEKHGLIDTDRNCYFQDQVNDTFWTGLKNLSTSSRLPADEYFQ